MNIMDWNAEHVIPYEVKTGEKLVVANNDWTTIIFPDGDFIQFKVVNHHLWLGNTSGKFKFNKYKSFAFAVATINNCNAVVTTTTRNKEAYSKLTGATYIRDIDVDGEIQHLFAIPTPCLGGIQ